MVSFTISKEEDDNVFGKEILDIQGMDIHFILKNYSMEVLNNYIEEGLLDIFRMIEKDIDKATGDARDSLLRHSVLVIIDHHKKFKPFIESLVKQQVIFTRKKLLSIQEETREVLIANLEEQNPESNLLPKNINPYYYYQLNSYKFAKYVKEKLAYCDYIVGILDSGLANKKKATATLRDVKYELASMGYEFNSEENNTARKKGKVMFFCDIMNTIDRGTALDFNELGLKLVGLKEKHEAEDIVFSLITGDSEEEYLMQYFDNVNEYLNLPGIVFGKQFMRDKYFLMNEGFENYFKHNKIDKIIDYTNELKKESDIVAVYYVDDNPTYATDSIKDAFGDTYYHALSIEDNKNFNGENITSTIARNINGVLEVMDVYLNSEMFEENSYQKVYTNDNDDEYAELNFDDDGDLPF